MSHEIDASAARFMLQDMIEIIRPRCDGTGSLWKRMTRQYTDRKSRVGLTRVLL